MPVVSCDTLGAGARSSSFSWALRSCWAQGCFPLRRRQRDQPTSQSAKQCFHSLRPRNYADAVAFSPWTDVPAAVTDINTVTQDMAIQHYTRLPPMSATRPWRTNLRTQPRPTGRSRPVRTSPRRRRSSPTVPTMSGTGSPTATCPASRLAAYLARTTSLPASAAPGSQMRTTATLPSLRPPPAPRPCPLIACACQLPP